MPKIKRDLRGGEWRRTQVVNVLSDRVNLFFTEHDAVKRKRRHDHAGEMKNSEKFQFIADGVDPPE